MKRVGSLKSVFKSQNSKQSENNNDLNDKDEMSILGNSVGSNHLQIQNQKDSSGSISIIPKGLSNFFHKNVPLKGTLTRNKNKDKPSVKASCLNLQCTLRSRDRG